MESAYESFKNKKITVTFLPKKCCNSERCTVELSSVFRATVIPWIDLDGASSKNIIKQIDN